MDIRRGVVTAALVVWGLAGCQTIVGPPSEDQPWSHITGRLIWDNLGAPERQTLAVWEEQAKGATVTLHDIADPQKPFAVATTITDVDGRFSLTATRGWVPKAGQVYMLEAYNGIYHHSPGADATRLRTLIAFSGGWRGLAGDATISSGTTALAMIWQYRANGPNPTASAKDLLGSLQEPAAAFSPGNTLISVQDFSFVRTQVRLAMDNDCDPVHCIAFDGNAFTFTAINGPVINFFVPPASTVGTVIAINGLRFEGNPIDNLVEFSGVVASVVSGTTTELKVRVPAGATTGPVKITNLKGAYDYENFQVNPLMNGKFNLF